MNDLLIFAVDTGFADKLRASMWMAYGPLLKTVGVIVLAIVVGGPLIGFLRRLVR